MALESEGRVSEQPSPETLAWATRAIGEGAALTAVRPLEGGSSSAVYALDVRDAAGRVHELVLRRFTNANWLAKEPDLAEHEAAALQAAAGVPIPAPRLVAFDPKPAHGDVPLVLMTRLRGGVYLSPKDLEPWLEQLAGALATVHGLEGAAIAWEYSPWFNVEEMSVPAWAMDPGPWRALFSRVRAGAPETRRGFLHRDFHPGNILFHRAKVSGIVDWVNACMGPLEVDVSHCRANLAVIHGMEAADAFDRAYRAQTGAPAADPYWDAAQVADADTEDFSGLLAFNTFGLELTVEAIQARLDAFARAAASRL